MLRSSDMATDVNMKSLNWGILGTGNIAKAFAKALPHSKTGKLVAVGSRTQKSADEFGKTFGAVHCHDSYEALLANPEVEAVYISLPHPMHPEWAIKCAQAGKHILCEKPIALNHKDALKVIKAAKKHDVFLMEAFMYRCHPQIPKLIELIRNKVIGDVRLIHATFSFRSTFNINSRTFNQALGGGGILDVGCYCTSMSRLIAGIATGKDFAEPIEVNGSAYIGKESRVDEWAAATLKFPGNILAQLVTGVNLVQQNNVRVHGSNGTITVTSPWIPTRESGSTTIIVEKHGGVPPEEIQITTDEYLYGMEADMVANHIKNRQAPSPAMTWDDTLGNMKTLDQWRKCIGLVYDEERRRK